MLRTLHVAPRTSLEPSFTRSPSKVSRRARARHCHPDLYRRKDRCGPLPGAAPCTSGEALAAAPVDPEFPQRPADGRGLASWKTASCWRSRCDRYPVVSALRCFRVRLR
jgi:hypothetical protein